jgi:hypothetical protein
MRTKTIHYERNGLTASVTVGEATTLIGMRRTRMRYEAGQAEKALRDANAGGTPDPDESILRLVTYPDLVAPIVEIDINGEHDTPGLSQFMELPETFVMEWENAVYELNGHWLPRSREGDDEKKAPTISTSG